MPTSQEHIDATLSSILDKFASITGDKNLPDFRQHATAKFLELQCFHSEFTTFMEGLVAKQDTISFWYQFVTADCFVYLALYTGIRNCNWRLHTGSLKLMASVFHAFDRPIYHRSDLARTPQSILQHLVQGGFSVRLSTTEWHAVALDECHKMCINKMRS